jgi:hypothetical protein
MTTIKLHKDFLMGELGLPDSAIVDKLISNSRWSELHEIVFAYNDKFYRTHYSQGLTEYQYESPWGYSKEIECIEVELVKNN